MAISDKVIELETVKKGRNIIFIALIAVLAAASIIFGVLWAVKKPATDPPKVDSITAKTEDVFSAAGDSENSSVSKVSVGNSYKLNYTVYLPSSATFDDINPLIQVVAEPSNWVSFVEPEIKLDPSIPNLIYYNYTFKINSSAVAGGKLRLIASSIYGEKRTTITDLIIDDQSTRHFLIDSVYLVKNSENVPVGVSLKDGEYHITQELPYYSGALASQNLLPYYINFSQLGEIGKDGKHAKIASGIKGTNDKYADQVDVFVQSSGGEWEHVDDENGNSDALMLNLGTSDAYCRRQISFRSRKEAISKIKFVANSFKAGAQPLETILNIKFVSVAKMDRITDIQFRNPTTQQPVNSFDLYIGEATASNLFVISNNIYVHKKGEWIKAYDKDDKDAEQKLRGALWDSNLTASIDSTKVFSTVTAKHNFAIYQSTEGVTGTAKITVRDRSVEGFGVSTDFTINLKSPITSPKIGANSASRQEVGKGETRELELSYTTSYATEDVNRLNKALTFLYSSPDVSEFSIPIFTTTGALDPKVKSSIIELEGLRQIKEEKTLFAFDPTALVSSQDKKTFTQTLKFNIGADVKSGTYVLEFLLPCQSGFRLDPVKFSVSFTVTDVAKTVSVDNNYAFKTDSDPFVKFAGVNNELYLPIRVGKQTTFSLLDILIFRDESGKIIKGVNKYLDVKIINSNNFVLELGDFFSNTVTDPVTNRKNLSDMSKFELGNVISSTQIKVNIKLRNPANPNETFPEVITLPIKFYKPVTSITVADFSEHIIKFDGGKSVPTNSNLNDTISYKNINGDNLLINDVDSIYKIHVNVLINHGNTKYMLKKNVLNGITYFYDFNVSANEMTLANALFKYESNQIYIVKDLFAFSYNKLVNGSFAYDNFNIMYSLQDITANNDGTFDAPTEASTTSGKYKAMRTYNKLEVYTNGTYDTVLTPRKIGSRSGEFFAVYASGVITYDTDKEFIVEKNNNYKNQLNIDTLQAPTTSVTDEALTLTHNKASNLFNGVCGVGSFAGSIVYSYDGVDSLNIKITVSNKAVPIKSIEIVGLTGNKLALYQPNSYNYGSASAEVSFKVTFEKYNASYFELERFRFGAVFNLIGSNLKMEWAKEFDNKLPSTIKDGDEHFFEGKLKITLSNDTPFGIHNITISADSTLSKIAQFNVEAFSPASYISVSDGTNTFTSSTSGGVGVDGTLNLQIKSKDSATATFTNSFITQNVDAKVDDSKFNISYAFLNNDNNYLNVISYDNNKANWKIEATGRVLDEDNTYLTVTFTETINGTIKVHYIKIKIIVEVSVYSVKAKVAENETNKYEIALTGKQDEQKFNLSSIINDGEQKHSPTSELTVEFRLTETKKGTSTLTDFVSEQFMLVFDITNKNYSLVVKNNFEFWKYDLFSISASAYTSKNGIKSEVFVSQEINIVFTSKQYVLSFDSNLTNGGSKTVFDYNAVDFKAKLVNVADSQKTIALTNSAYGVVDSSTTNGVTAVLNGTKVSITNGNKGSYTVTVTYTNTDNNETYTILHTVNFYALVSNIIVKDEGTSIIVNGGNLLKGKTYKFVVTPTSAISGTPFSTDFTFTNSLNLNVTREGNILTVVSTGGQATLTITTSNNLGETNLGTAVSKNLSFNTDAPHITLTPTGDSIIELNSDNKNYLEFTASVVGYKPTLTPVILNDTDNVFTIELLSSTASNNTYDNKYKISLAIPYSQLTAQHLKEYTLQVSGTVDDSLVNIQSATHKFTLTLNITPTIKIVDSNNGEISNVLDLNQHTKAKYKVSLGGYNKFVDNNATVVYKGVEVNQNGEITSELIYGTSITVYAQVTILGKMFETNRATYSITDSATIAINLYESTKDSNAENGTILISNSAEHAIDYVTDGYYISLCIDFSNTPVVGIVNTTNFSVALSRGGVSFVEGSNSIKDNKYYAKYKFTTVGEITFAATIAKDGFIYKAYYSIVLACTPPTITVAVANAINPGATADITVSVAQTSFKGNVSHVYSIVAGAELATIENTTLKAKTNTNGGKVTVKVISTVDSGIFKGNIYTNYIDFTINSLPRPTVEVKQKIVLLPNAPELTINESYFKVTTNNSSEITNYTTTYTVDSSFGTVTNGKFTVKQAVNAISSNIIATTTFNGCFEGLSITSNIPFVILPTATVTKSSGYVLPFNSATFEVSLPEAIATNDYTVKYSVNDSTLGYISGNAFTASQKTGTATITATITFVSGTFASIQPITATTEISVNALTLSSGNTLTATPGGVLSLNTNFNETSSAIGTFEIRDINDINDYAKFFSLNGNNLTALNDANFTGASKTFKLYITYAKNDGSKFASVIDFTLLSKTKPTLNLTATLNGSTTHIDLNSEIVINQGDEISIAVALNNPNDYIDATLTNTTLSSSAAVGKTVVNTDNKATFTAVDSTESAFSLTIRTTVYGMEISQIISNIKITAKSTTGVTVLPSSPDVGLGQEITIVFKPDKTEQYIYGLSFGVSSIYNYVSKIVISTNTKTYTYVPSDLYVSGATYYYSSSTIKPSELNTKANNSDITMKLTMRTNAINSASSTNISLSITATMVNILDNKYAPSVAANANFRINTVEPSEVKLSCDVNTVRAGNSIKFSSRFTDSNYAIKSYSYTSNNVAVSVTENGIATVSDDITSITKAKVKATLKTGTDKVKTSAEQEITFVPKNTIVLKDGSSISQDANGFITAGTYQLSLKNNIGSETVTYTVNGVSQSNSSATFTAGTHLIVANYTINGVTFTENITVTMIEAPKSITVSSEIIENGIKYTATTLTPSTFSCVAKNYDSYLNISKELSEGGKKATFTVTRKANSSSATDLSILLEFSATVSEGIYKGVVSTVAQIFTFAKTAPPALVLNDSGSQITYNHTDYTNGNMQYVVTSGFNFVNSLNNESGEYVLISQATSDNKVTVMAIFTFNQQSGYNGTILTAVIQLTVPKEVEPEFLVEYDNLLDSMQIVATPTIADKGIITFTSTDTNYVTVDENGNITNKKYESSTELLTKDIEITVTYTITSGVYAGNIYTKTTTVTAYNTYLNELVLSESTVDNTTTISYNHADYTNGTIQYSLVNEVDMAYISSLDNASGEVVFIPQDTSIQVIIEATLTFSEGVNKGKTLTKQITLNVPTNTIETP